MKINNDDILKKLKSEDEYIKEIKDLHQELGFAIFTNTLIVGEYEKLIRRMYEKIAIVEFIRSCENEK